MNKLIILTIILVGLISCKKESNNNNSPISDSLLFVKKISWPTMTGSEMFLKVNYKNKMLSNFASGVNGLWLDSLYCYYSDNIVDSAIYYTRSNNIKNPLIIRILLQRTNGLISTITKYSVNEEKVINTFHLYYKDNKLIELTSIKYTYPINNGNSNYENPFYLISKRIGFPYFTIMADDNGGSYYGSDLNEKLNTSNDYQVDNFGRIIGLVWYGPPDTHLLIEYY